jgi:hypothetical protein
MYFQNLRLIGMLVRILISVKRSAIGFTWTSFAVHRSKGIQNSPSDLPRDVISRFFIRPPLRAFITTTKLPFETIYSILQQHFRPPPTAPSTNPVQVLESIIQRKDAEIVAYIENLAKADRDIEVMRGEIFTVNIKLR